MKHLTGQTKLIQTYISLVTGLMCYQCSSTTSLKDCEAIQKAAECPVDSSDHCFRESFTDDRRGHIQSALYRKGCSTCEVNDYLCKKAAFQSGALATCAMLLHYQGSAPSWSSHALVSPFCIEILLTQTCCYQPCLFITV